MHIKIKDTAIEKVSADVLFVGLEVEADFSAALSALDKITAGFFTRLKKQRLLPEKDGHIRTFYQLPNIKAQSVAVIAYKADQKGLPKAAKNISAYLGDYRIKQAAVTLTGNDFADLSLTTKAKLLVQNLLSAAYICDDYKSEKEDKHATDIILLSNKKDRKAITAGVRQGSAIAAGMNTLKTLGNAPGNVCTPRYLAAQAKKLARQYDSLSVDILKEKDIKALKMGALLSVAKGSIEKPRLIKLEHKGGEGDPIILVGKGVTFDSGGISLKPGAGMDEMKYDMCGAGSVIGTMQAVAMLDLPVNVIGIIPSVENMPSDRASKPGDIVTSMSGKTIEILNTDAEGRLILCDAITYARQFKPKALIDIATLTGAVIIGLGRHPSGLMSNNDELAKQLIQAGETSADRVWQLPIWPEYVEQLKSPFADLQNIGGREAGTITAGCFLGEFAKDIAWAHLDIAGTAWQTRKAGATGRPVPLLVEYIMAQL
ncbi:MAG: leucyl aminopeptidase [Gammaproteobacteria bacterium]|nr:MAG: leucyl aminopeptidase [Gammaproteobacteria bacterium]